MRKYIKTMRQQFDNNSVIFKEAKKMFHYVPNASENRHFGLKQNKTKSEHDRVIKDDFSSVKDLKNENNEINESSWIAKLVNGIQEHSLEEAKTAHSQEFKGKVSSASDSYDSKRKDDLKSIKSQNVVIITSDEKLPLQNIQNRPLSINQHPTKKNSYNFRKKSQNCTEKSLKKREKRENGSQCEASQISQSKSRTKTMTSRDKQIQRKGSQSDVKCTANRKKDLGTKKKSLQKISVIRTKEERRKSTINGDSFRLSDVNQKPPSTSQTKQKRERSEEEEKRCKMNESLMEMQEIKCVTENKVDNCPSQHDYFKSSQDEPLFGGSNKSGEQTVERVKMRIGCGSIRKNSKKLFEDKEKQTSFKQQSTQALYSPKFSSTSKVHEQILIKPETQDLISATEEKRLVDKYLGSNYDSSNPDKNIQPFRKDSGKKYHYELPDKNINQDIEIDIPQRKEPSSRSRSYFEKNLLGESRHPKYQENNPRIQKLQPRSMRYCYQKDEIAQLQSEEKNVAVQNITIRKASAHSNGYQIKEKRQRNGSQINKNAYLSSQTDSLMMDSYKSSAQKQQRTVLDRQTTSIGIPSKYSYLTGNSVPREKQIQSVLLSGQKSTSHQHLEGSDQVIDRLNSKLSFYICQHKLDSDRTKQWDSSEPTHRAMNLNFRQLKKHGQINKH